MESHFKKRCSFRTFRGRSSGLQLESRPFMYLFCEACRFPDACFLSSERSLDYDDCRLDKLSRQLLRIFRWKYQAGLQCHVSTCFLDVWFGHKLFLVGASQSCWCTYKIVSVSPGTGHFQHECCSPSIHACLVASAHRTNMNRILRPNHVVVERCAQGLQRVICTCQNPTPFSTIGARVLA